MIDFSKFISILLIIIVLLSIITAFYAIDKKNKLTEEEEIKHVLFAFLAFVTCIILLFSINFDHIKEWQYGKQIIKEKKCLQPK